MIRSSKYNMYRGACAASRVASAALEAIDPPSVNVRGSVTLHPADKEVEAYASLFADENRKWNGGVHIDEDGPTIIHSNGRHD